MKSVLGLSLSRDNRVWIDRLAAVVLVLILIASAVYLNHLKKARLAEVEGIRLRHHKAAEEVLATKVGHVEGVLREMDQDVLLVGSLPEAMRISGNAHNPRLADVARGNAPHSEAEQAVLRMYEALSTGLPVSEVYCVLKGFHPDLTGSDPAGERPYFEVGKPKRSTGGSPYEMIEYAWMAQAVKAMEAAAAKLPRNARGLIPRAVSPELVTREVIDDGKPASRHGFIIATPFYRDSGEFEGAIAVVFQRRDVGAAMAGVGGSEQRGRFLLVQTESNIRLTEPEGKALRSMSLDDPAFVSMDLAPEFPAWRLYYLWNPRDMEAEIAEVMTDYRGDWKLALGLIVAKIAVLTVLWRLWRKNGVLRAQAAELKEMQTLMDNADGAIIVLDIDCRIQVWNRMAERIHEIPAASALGSDIRQLLFTKAVGKVPAVEEVAASGKWLGDIEYTTGEGLMLIVESHWSVIRDGEGHPKGFFVVEYDMTEKHVCEFQLRRAQRMENIGALASGVAHDLNNALTPVIVGMQMLDKMRGEMERKALQKTILASAQRGTAMVRQILSFVRGTQGEDGPIQIGHLLEEMTKIVRDTFPKAVTIEARPGKNLHVVNGNATELHQVLLNLCVNGRDAMMPKGGALILSAENATLTLRDVTGPGREGVLPGEFLVITVADSGGGIPAHILPKIFEPLFTTKEPGKGTGLGLSTVSAIVKRMGGFIGVESEAGRGTRFSIHLPALLDSEVEEKKSEETHELPLGSGQRVLLVDDDNTIRRLSKVMLENYGYRVVAATNGLEALSLYAQQEEPIHLVISDVDMPYMGGPELAASLHAKDPELPVILISGSDLTEEQLAGVGRESLGFLIKPYTVEGLIREVGRHVGAVTEPHALASAAEI
ncbi:PAS fold [Verrucomicrobium sp. GAS474]|uniref:hybrid sensor histidine kinase/response regulator n=1 Tax=Verrucomicrobium sp. GAS474 TaxID=1882831 RepID=UPI00087999D4|nr:ATP-binding protein [Verrucomicrobium sp. GAS474]SDT86758.1 PAS fold [Verrucomicrobium sp. GAS474]